MKRRILGEYQNGEKDNWLLLDKPLWLVRPKTIYNGLKCKHDTCTNQSSVLCKHCQWAYCRECYNQHIANNNLTS